MLHYLRIAVTALSLTACVLLVALWVRSYWRLDTVHRKDISVQSVQGILLCSSYDVARDRWVFWSNAKVAMDYVGAMEDSGFRLVFGFGYKFYGDGRAVVVPLWLPVLVTASLATVPWIHWSRRFTLRTLLIATTLVAVVLGIIAISS
jgi:hypothetical protein